MEHPIPCKPSPAGTSHCPSLTGRWNINFQGGCKTSNLAFYMYMMYLLLTSWETCRVFMIFLTFTSKGTKSPTQKIFFFFFKFQTVPALYSALCFFPASVPISCSYPGSLKYGSGTRIRLCIEISTCRRQRNQSISIQKLYTKESHVPLLEVLSTDSGTYGSHSQGHSVGPLVLTLYIRQ